MIKALKETLSTITDAEARAEHKRLVKAENLYLKAAEAAGNYALVRKILAERDEKEENETISFSRMNNLTLSENVDNVMKMKDDEALRNNGTFVSITQTTPDVILDNVKDAKNLETIMRFDAFYLATRHSGVLQGHYHNCGELMKKLPEIISDSQAIIRLDSGRLNIISVLPSENGENGIVSIELNTVKDINSKNKTYNLVISVMPTNDNYIANVVQKRAVAVEYEKEDLLQVNPQLYKWLATVNSKSSTNIIPDSSEKSNSFSEKSEKIQMSRVSEGGKTLNKAQTEALESRGITGDELLDAIDLADEILAVDGEITEDAKAVLYHGTTEESAKKIIETGKMYGKEDNLFFSTKKDGIVLDYGETVVEARIPLEKLQLNDVFDDEIHLTMSVKPYEMTNIRFSRTTSAKTVEKYTEEQYNNYGWVRANNVLTAGYWRNFTENFAQAVENLQKYPQTEYGEFMISVYDVYSKSEVADVIVFAKGTIESPIISQVVKIDLTQDIDIEAKRSELYASKRKGIRRALGEVFICYDKSDFISERKYERSSSQSYRNNNQLGTKRSRSEIKTNPITQFNVNEDENTVTYTYANGETITESLGEASKELGNTHSRGEKISFSRSTVEGNKDVASKNANDTHVTVTRGLHEKEKAKYQSDKVYSRKDVLEILKTSFMEHIPSAKREEIADELWQERPKNTAESPLFNSHVPLLPAPSL